MIHKAVSIVVPCYNEEATIVTFYHTVETVLSKFPNDVDFEYIFVDDGSSDTTLSVLQMLSEKDSHVKYLSFSRNFGKESNPMVTMW